MDSIVSATTTPPPSPHHLSGLVDLRGFDVLATPVWLVLCAHGCVIYANPAARRLWRERVPVVPWSSATGLSPTAAALDEDTEPFSVLPQALADDLANGGPLPDTGQRLQDRITLVHRGSLPQEVDCSVTMDIGRKE